LINTAFDEKRFVLNLKKEFISQLIEKNINVYIIDAYKIAKENNLGKKINNILVSIFLNLCDELNNKKILALYLDEIKKIFPSDAENNINAVDSSLAQLKKISNEMLNDASIVDTLYQNKISSYFDNKINDLFYRQGDKLPVSEFSSEKKYRSCGEKNKFNRDIIF
jgi:pyruvate-ferredoxin/flavodoxin oxidoreductase